MLDKEGINTNFGLRSVEEMGIIVLIYISSCLIIHMLCVYITNYIFLPFPLPSIVLFGVVGSG